MRIKVFKNGPCKICGNQSLKNFTWTILKYGDSSIYLFFHLFIYLFIYVFILFTYIFIYYAVAIIQKLKSEKVNNHICRAVA